MRVEVYATDGRGAASDAVPRTLHGRQHRPDERDRDDRARRRRRPTTWCARCRSGFADIDGDTLTYQYQWLRNGTAISRRHQPHARPRRGRQRRPRRPDRGRRHGRTTATAARARSCAAPQSITATNSAPVRRHASAIAPAPPRTDQTLTATPSGFVERDGQAITYSYRWLRNGTADQRRDREHAQPLAGRQRRPRRRDRASRSPAATRRAPRARPSTAQASIVNSAPGAGHGDGQAGRAGHQRHRLGLGDGLHRRRRRRRDATSTSGSATARRSTARPARSLDLSQPGNGDLGDLIEVEVTALDGHGGTSGAARAGRTISSNSSNPVASFGFEEAAGTVAVNETGASRRRRSTAPARENAGRFGRALSFDGEDDIVDRARRPGARADDRHDDRGVGASPTRRPTGAPSCSRSPTADWRTSLYANSLDDNPSVARRRSTATPASTATDTARPERVDAPRGHLRRQPAAALRQRRAGRPRTPTRASCRATPAALTIGANHALGRALLRPDRRGPRLQPPPDGGRDRDRHGPPGGRRARRSRPPTTAPDAVGRFAAPQEWPITPVHLALTNDGKVAAWDGFDAAAQLRAPVGSVDGPVRRHPDRPQPLLRRPHPAPGRAPAGGRRPHPGLRGHEGHEPLQPAEPHLAARRRHGARALVPDRHRPARRPRVRRLRRRGRRSTNQHNENVEVPLRIASQTTPEIYNPASEHLDPGAERGAHDAALPVHVRAARRPPVRRRSGADDAHAEPRHGPVDERRQQPDRRHERGHVPARARSSSPAPGPIPSSRAARPRNRAARIDMTASSPAWQEAAPMKYRRSYNTLTVLPDGKVLSTGGQRGTDGVDETHRRAARRDVGSGHRHVEDDGLEPPSAPVPLVGAAAARRPRPARRRRRVRHRQEREERRDLLPAVPLQGPAADRHRRRRTRSTTASRSTSTRRTRRGSRRSRSSAWAR